jgi:LasA protease
MVAVPADFDRRCASRGAPLNRPGAGAGRHRLAAALILCLSLGCSGCNFPAAYVPFSANPTITALQLTLAAIPFESTPSLTPPPAAEEASPSPASRVAGSPTPYSFESEAVYHYQVLPGDTLDGLAGRFGVEPAQIQGAIALSATGYLPAGEILTIPKVLGSVTSAQWLLPDSEVVYSPAAVDFDTEAFITQAGGDLASYTQTIAKDDTRSGAAILQKVAAELSVNPRLLIGLLEFRSGWVFGKPAPDKVLAPFGFQTPARSGLYQELTIAGSQLNRAFYGWQAGSYTELTFPDGSKLRLDPTLNAGTVALLHLLTYFDDLERWQADAYGAQGFLARYQAMFGDALQRAAAAGPLLPPGLTQPILELPIPPGQAWSLTGGPHETWNGGTPRGALDFSPITDEPPCAVSRDWATASASGVIVRAADNAVALDLDGDGSEATGWVLVYLHLAAQDLIAYGSQVGTGRYLGHPSCEGGRTTGTHVHLARKYNGVWLAADGPVAMVLSGWRAVAGAADYAGQLVRDGQAVSADPSGRQGSTIRR